MEELRGDERSARWLAMVEGRWEEFGADRPEVFRARVATRCRRDRRALPGQRVVAVCHGGVINVALASVLGIDRHLWFEPHYTSLSRHGRVAHRRPLGREPQRARAPRSEQREPRMNDE